MTIGGSRQAGDALEAVLHDRDSGVEPGAGRTLFLALLALHSAGMLAFESGGAVHGPRPTAGPGTVVRGGVVGLETGPAYNMPSLFASDQVSE